MSTPLLNLDDLPDPDNKQLAWWHGEPAMLTWWRRITRTTAIASEIHRLHNHYRLHARYAHAVPTLKALGALAELGPLIEIGAGAGYWTRLLRDMDCDVIAIDYISAEENLITAGHAWTQVDIGNVDTLASYPDRAVFACWPERPHGFMPDLLDRAPQKTLALITDGPIPPADGGDPMYERLSRGWLLEKEIAIPLWPSHDERLAIWTRAV